MNKRPVGDVLISITGEVGPEVAFYCSNRFCRLPAWQRDWESASDRLPAEAGDGYDNNP